MKKLFSLSLFLLFTQFLIANTIDYEAAKKYILENYSCDTMESCNKKNKFSHTELQKDFENNKALRLLQHRALTGDEQANQVLHNITQANEAITKELARELNEFDKKEHMSSKEGLTNTISASTALAGAFMGGVFGAFLPSGVMDPVNNILFAPIAYPISIVGGISVGYLIGGSAGLVACSVFVNLNDLNKFTFTKSAIKEITEINKMLEKLKTK